MAQKTNLKPVLAFDVGGTKIAAGVVDRRGKVTRYTAIGTPHTTTAHLINAVVELAGLYPKLPIVMGLAGQVDKNTGRWRLSSHILKARPTIAIVSLLRRKLNRPVAIDNDAHCFALAEARFGAGKKYRDFIGVTWGTGIGGGLFLNGSLYRGFGNTAGEVGHLVVPSGKQFIAWEHYCGGPLLAKEYLRLTGTRASNNEIIGRWRKRERAAVRAVETITERFGAGLASLANVLAPEAIIVGGGFGQIPGLLTMARKSFRRYALGPAVAQTAIIPSKLKKHAVLLGAASLQRGRFRL